VLHFLQFGDKQAITFKTEDLMLLFFVFFSFFFFSFFFFLLSFLFFLFFFFSLFSIDFLALAFWCPFSLFGSWFQIINLGSRAAQQ